MDVHPEESGYIPDAPVPGLWCTNLLGLIALTPWGNSGNDLRPRLVRRAISAFERGAYGAAAFTCMSTPRGR